MQPTANFFPPEVGLGCAWFALKPAAKTVSRRNQNFLFMLLTPQKIKQMISDGYILACKMQHYRSYFVRQLSAGWQGKCE